MKVTVAYIKKLCLAAMLGDPLDNRTMNAETTESFPDENLLATESTSYVVEYLQAMEDDLALQARCHDAPETGSTLWPEGLYPDMYGKILDQAQMDRAIRFQSAQELNLSTSCESPCAVGMSYLQTQTAASEASADTTSSPSAVLLDRGDVVGAVGNTYCNIART